jgi:hypothetical protein
MPRPDFTVVRRDMLGWGISPRQVRRTISELDGHFDDLVDDAIAKGVDTAAAQQIALDALGDLQHVSAAMKSRPELRSWAYRFPHIAMIVYPLTCIALIPALPIAVGVAHASYLARWGFCMLLGALITASMFLLLHLSITLA